MQLSGRLLITVILVFLGYDVVAKLGEIEPIHTATRTLGFSRNGVLGLAAFEALLVLIAAIPRLRRLGVLLLTAFLSAATCTQIIAGHSFAYRAFPLVLLAMLWTGHGLSDRKWFVFFLESPSSGNC